MSDPTTRDELIFLWRGLAVRQAASAFEADKAEAAIFTLCANGLAELPTGFSEANHTRLATLMSCTSPDGTAEVDQVEMQHAYYVKEIRRLQAARVGDAEIIGRHLSELGAERALGEKLASDLSLVDRRLAEIVVLLEEARAEMARLGRLDDALNALVRQQAADEGLWFKAKTAPEGYLQQELRRLHAAIEGQH